MGLYSRFRDACRGPLQDGAFWLGQGFGGMVASKDPSARAIKTDLPLAKPRFHRHPTKLEAEALSLAPSWFFSVFPEHWFCSLVKSLMEHAALLCSLM